jgi:NADPH:quinone reductase-like Zn-dependent oxidoreductase
MLAQMLGRGFYSLFISQSVKGMIAKMNAGDLETLARMCEQAQVRPVIDHSYPLKETAEAVRYLETMRARGKVVIAVS